MVFTFGKYKGASIDEIYTTDRSYLLWVATKYEASRPAVIKQVQYIKSMVERDVEKFQHLEIELKKHRQHVYVSIIRLLGGACMKSAIKRGTQISTWIQSIIISLQNGDQLSFRAQEIIADVCGKGSGRRNSKAYNEVFDVVTAAFQLANNTAQHN